MPYTDCESIRGIRRQAIILFPAPKQNLGSHKFKDERKAGFRYKSADTWTPTVTSASQ